jgi:hypothetical protein
MAEAAGEFDVDGEVAEALAICGGDPMAALKAALIAIAFLEAEIERLAGEVECVRSAVSSGFDRGRVRKPAKKREVKL